MDWETLKADCLACSRCELCKTRTNVVFGQGVPDAEVLFVGEGPGQSEDEQGLPFVGRSGQLLDKYLFAIDLDREKNCYIANIVKCRPPQNRDPLPAESEACMPWLREQFPAAAQDRGVPGPHRRPADDPFRLFGDQGARAVHGEERHPVHGHLPPGRPAARPAEQAQCLCRLCGSAGQDPRSV